MFIAEAALDDAVGLGGGARVIALGLANVSRDVGLEVVMDLDRSGIERTFEIDDRRKMRELDHDVVERVFGDIAIFGDDDRERFPDMANLVLGKRDLGSLVEYDSGNRRRRHQQRTMLPVGT